MLVTLDFESYHDDDYTLKKQSTSEYVRDARFEAISCAIKIDDGPTKVYFGKEDVQVALDELDWSQVELLAHHTHFDGLILSHHFGKVPAKYRDTLSMGRALHPKGKKNDLGSITSYYPQVTHHKGQMPDFKGKHVADLTPEERADIITYNAADVDATYAVYYAMLELFPEGELELVDLTVRMFADPVLRVDEKKAKKELTRERRARNKAIRDSGVDLDTLASNPKFVAALATLGVEVPTKPSPSIRDKVIPAIAKSDEALQALLTHPEESVRKLVAGRLAAKSTISESRAVKLLLHGGIDVVSKKRLGDWAVPMYYNFFGAHTGRWSGGDKLNPQNFKRATRKGGALRSTICAPEGFVVVAVDASQIEARVTAWLAGQEDVLEAFRQGRDLYCEYGTKVYGRVITKADVTERFVSKVCVLQLGFGSGGPKLQSSIRIQSTDQGMEPVLLDLGTCYFMVNMYRKENAKITALWKIANDVWIPAMMHEDQPHEHMCLRFEHERVVLPNGLALLYPYLDANIVKTATSGSFKRAPKTSDTVRDASYLTEKGRTKLYGGLLVENVVQALARIIVADVMVKLSKRYRVVMMTHDEIAFLAPKDEGAEALAYAMELMAQPPSWAPDLPLSSEGKFDVCYSK